ncbi:alpha/beta fold hydrolase [Desulfurobacterium pacificum]|uniref:alpha/beta fold hydrolase n=1 Tax=Desulfurobacterium pacificum TaxID=240166 RepID=UPI0024B6677B|nr:alpha/beta hydrolase [Desulfurobacterium pacificum]
MHGWSFTPLVWKETILANANHIALPGHGESPYKSTNLIQLSLEIGKDLPHQITLIGWSLGATLATLIASQFPQKVEKLILIAPTLKFMPLSQPEVVVKRFLKKLNNNFFSGITYFRQICGANLNNVQLLKEEKARELLKSYVYFSLSPYVKNFPVKTVIAVGEEDNVTGLIGAYKLFNEMNNSKLIIYPKEDHFSILRRLDSLL